MKHVWIIPLFSFIIHGCLGHQPSIKTGLEGNPMPNFKMLLIDSITVFNISSFSKNEPIVLFYFSPQCPYCRAQTTELIKEIASVKQIRFYLLSNFPINYIKDYYNQFKLNKYENIMVGQDYKIFVGNYFKPSAVPYIAVYSKEKRLKQVLIGSTKIQQIKNIALE